MAEIQYPQYPVQEGPSFSSLAQRQRMEIEDALAAEQAQKDREQRVITQGGKAFVGYNEMLRGFMEAKYASPELKFWDYVQNPSVSAAYRLEGKRKILEDVKSGVDPKDIPGMKFGERHKAGLKGIFGKDAVPKLEGEDLIIDTMEKLGAQKEASQAAEKKLASQAAEEEFVTPTVQDQIAAAKARRASAGGGTTAAAKQKAQIIQQKNIDSLEIDPIANYAGEPSKVATEEATKGGLKSTLGKVAGGIGAGVSIASGVERMKSRDEATQLGGAMQTAGGVAQAVALTNWWNPAGGGAAIPAALSIGGSFVGGDRGAIGRTPVGRTLRRLNIS